MVRSSRCRRSSAHTFARAKEFASTPPAVEGGVSLETRRKHAMTDLATHYLEEARKQMRGQKRMGEGAMAQLRDEEFFVTLDPEANSIAILVKHLAGNMRSRFSDFLTTDGEKPDRFRDREFEVNAALTRADVLRWGEEGWAIV